MSEYTFFPSAARSGWISVTPPIPHDLSATEQVELVIQKLEFVRSAVENGHFITGIGGNEACAFCCNCPECRLCPVSTETGSRCGQHPGARALNKHESTVDEQIAGIDEMLSALVGYKESLERHRSDQVPD